MANNKNSRNQPRMTKAEREALAIKRAKRQRLISTVTPFVVIALLVALILILGFTVGGWGQPEVYVPTATYHAAIEIEGYGTIHLELYGNDAPETVANFIKLANQGFYDGLTFHRIIDGFMMQGGCPNGNGSGKSDTTIHGEFSANGFHNKVTHTAGTISMAREKGYNSGSCQFFITDEDSPHCDGLYAAFGRVTSGMDIVTSICNAARPLDENGTIATKDQPKIVRVTVHPVH